MFTPLELILASVVALFAAAIQGSIGFGFAVLAVPLLTIIDPALTPIPPLIMSLAIGAASLWRERRNLDFEGIGWIISGRLPGSIIGAWILTIIAERTLSIVIAVVVLAAVMAMAGGLSIPLTRRNRVLTGLASGFTGTSAGIGGPPLALLYRSSAGGTVRSSLGAIFTIGITINLVVLGLAGVMTTTDWVAAGWLTPTSALGFAASSYVKHHFDGALLRRSILIIAGAAGTALLVRSLIG